MYLHTVFLLFFCVTVLSNVVNNLIFDYFVYKNTPSVVGFSCNFAEDDAMLVKNFNKNDMTAALSKLSNKLSIQRFAHTSYRKLGIFIDLRCYYSDRVASIFSEARNYRYYGDLHNWLILGSNISSILSILDDKAMGYSTDFTIVVPSSTTTNSYNFFEVYNIWKERGMKLNVTFMGEWNEKNHINIILRQTRYARRSNLHGATMKASFYNTKYKPVDMSWESYFQDYSSGTKDNLSKFGYAIVFHLSEMFNFKLEYIIAPKWEHGDPVGPITQSVYKNEVDITGSPTVLTLKRLYMQKFTFQSWPFRTCFVFRSPQRKSIKINEIFGPLDTNVWYFTMAIIILSISILATVFKYENNNNTLSRYSDSILATAGALCQQGSNVRMSLAATRVVFFFIMMFSYLIYNYYSASIVSIRLNEPILKLNDSLVQLAKTDLKLFSEYMVYFEFFIAKKDWETKTFAATRWQKIPENERWMEPERAMRLVQKGGFAYHVHPDVAYPFINRWYSNRETCELTEVHLSQPAYSNFGLNLNSTLVEMIRVGLTKMAEVGLRKRQVSRWTSKKPICQRNVLSVSSINMYEFAPHLIILGIGMGIALGVLVVEILGNTHMKLLM